MQEKSHSEEDTVQIAALLAGETNAPALICLYGDLGAGKSAFARGFIRTLASQDTDVPSPTFTLVQTYDTTKGTIYHYDLYRLEDAEEVYELSWDDALADGIVLVEWPERLGSLLPPARTDVKVNITDNEIRTIEIEHRDG
ncbi:MAG: tRNA (adenosine(37)-N6)-threonylcarbamoyltransferase complex ATPase subunit type 1 TsaE [Pseudomonadota bacterium]